VHFFILCLAFFRIYSSSVVLCSSLPCYLLYLRFLLAVLLHSLPCSLLYFRYVLAVLCSGHALLYLVPCYISLYWICILMLAFPNLHLCRVSDSAWPCCTGAAYWCSYFNSCVLFQIQPDLIVRALHIVARNLLIFSCVLFQIRPDLIALALHIDAQILLILSCVLFQIRPTSLYWHRIWMLAYH
jgi:hypothetical protein